MINFLLNCIIIALKGSLGMLCMIAGISLIVLLIGLISYLINIKKYKKDDDIFS